MLPKYFRLIVLNDTDQTLTYNNDARIEVTYVGWKFTSGVMEYASEAKQNAVFLTTGETLAADGQSIGTDITNASTLYLGLHGTFSVTADVTSTDGTMYLYMEESTDNSVWPSAAADFDITKHCTLIAALALSTDAVDEDAQVNFELN